jgi:type 1 glutamine amidotransferase
MLNFKTFKQVLFVALLLSSGIAQAQHEWQKPILRNRADIYKIMGPANQTELSREITIVWVWGVDYDHERGYHEYDWVMDLYVNKLLNKIPKITPIHVMYFPSKELWDKADLVVFYHHAFKRWEKPEYDLINKYQERGGGLIFIHESVIQRPGDYLANLIGLSWGIDDSKNGPSHWGAMPTPVEVTQDGNEHPILAGFSEKLDFVDELYWNLHGDPCQINVLITASGGLHGDSSRPAKPEEIDNKRWPAFWTIDNGKGKIFVSIPGHNYFLFNDPFYRIILFRAMAWILNESFDPFKPLVTEGIDFNVREE